MKPEAERGRHHEAQVRLVRRRDRRAGTIEGGLVEQPHAVDFAHGRRIDLGKRRRGTDAVGSWNFGGVHVAPIEHVFDQEGTVEEQGATTAGLRAEKHLEHRPDGRVRDCPRSTAGR